MEYKIGYFFPGIVTCEAPNDSLTFCWFNGGLTEVICFA